MSGRKIDFVLWKEVNDGHGIVADKWSKYRTQTKHTGMIL